jgi:uncharacterized protein
MESRPPGGGNRLAVETSPYLRQHAHNPVDWRPWGAEALSAARREDKPILLSIGYSACHWCHVMAHESFEDEATAALMNREFINVKVDREERPDLDKIYQIAQQMITQHGGGWPLTMFLTPEDQTPFFGGTYFPHRASHGMPAFTDILTRVAQYFHANREQIRAQKGAIDAAFAQLLPPPAGSVQLDAAPLRSLRSALAQSFDPDWGGFGQAPKFPHAAAIEHCLRAWAGGNAGEPDLHALYMASLTLTRMADGGLQDHLGGGFFRYSTDAHWMIPHFEKMLYDNAALLALYAQAAVATGEAAFARVAADTADWALRELRSPLGGFHAALDADSEGHEGRHYVFSRGQVKELLSPTDAALFCRRYGLDRDANFEGAWHLHVGATIESLALEFELPEPQVRERIEAARAVLLSARQRRPAPGLDDNILTAWNGLMIRALAVAARALQRPDLEAAATAAVDFLRVHAWRDGRLLACVTQGSARLDAYLDDHAFLADGLLELLQCRWRPADLTFLTQLLDVLLSRFEDPLAHGFFFTADDHEALLHRSKSFADEALPAGNAVAAAVLCKAGNLLGETRYLQAAQRTLQAGYGGMRDHPLAHAGLVNALQDQHAPAQIVILRGPRAQAAEWSRQLARLYAPHRLVFAIADDEPGLPAALAAKQARGVVCAYVCTGTVCSAPVSEFAELVAALRRSGV